MKNFLLMIGVLFMTTQVHAKDLSATEIVENANQQWNAAFNAGDIAALTSLYGSDASLSPGNGAIIEGHEAIAELFTGFKQNGVHNHSIKTAQIMATDEQITQLGYWQAQATDEQQQVVSFGGVLVTVLQKNAAGDWQLQSHVWNMAQ